MTTTAPEKAALAVFTQDAFKGGHGAKGQCSFAKQHEAGGKFEKSDVRAAFQRPTGKDGKQLQALCEDHAIAEYSADELAAALGSVQKEPAETIDPAAAAAVASDAPPASTAPAVKGEVQRISEWVTLAFKATAAVEPVREILDAAPSRRFGKGLSYSIISEDPQVFLDVAAALEQAAKEVLGGKARDASARAFMDVRQLMLDKAIALGADVDPESRKRHVETLVAERPKPEPAASTPATQDEADEIDPAGDDVDPEGDAALAALAANDGTENDVEGTPVSES